MIIILLKIARLKPNIFAVEPLANFTSCTSNGCQPIGTFVSYLTNTRNYRSQQGDIGTACILPAVAKSNCTNLCIISAVYLMSQICRLLLMWKLLKLFFSILPNIKSIARSSAGSANHLCRILKCQLTKNVLCDNTNLTSQLFSPYG